MERLKAFRYSSSHPQNVEHLVVSLGVHTHCLFNVICHCSKPVPETRPVIVFDGSNDYTQPILPPDGLTWRSIKVSTLHIHDVINHHFGLTITRSNNCHPFICLPRGISLKILGKAGHHLIYSALEACERLRKASLVRSDKKRIFGDYGKPVKYTCAGVQVDRRSQQVLDNAPYMEKLPKHHLKCLMKIMRRAEQSFQLIGDHQGISHIENAKTVVPFKTMSFPSSGINHSVRMFGGIAFGSNVFLHCHTDNNFTMSIAQVFLKGHNTYGADDVVVVYFCFPTLGAAVPLCPGDFLLFNALIPHCISSRCKQSDEVMCLSMYFKTA